MLHIYIYIYDISSLRVNRLELAHDSQLYMLNGSWLPSEILSDVSSSVRILWNILLTIIGTTDLTLDGYHKSRSYWAGLPSISPCFPYYFIDIRSFKFTDVSSFTGFLFHSVIRPYAFLMVPFCGRETCELSYVQLTFLSPETRKMDGISLVAKVSV